jgi:hypothetical protein
MATELGGEWECWYHFLYCVSNLTYPSGIGSHTYIQNFEEETEVSRAVAFAITMHYFLTESVLSLLDLEMFRPRVEGCIQTVLARTRN